MIRDDSNPFDPGDVEDRRGPLPPSQIRAAPATREGWVAVTIREAQAVRGRSPTKTFNVYFVPYTLFKGTDLSLSYGWQKLQDALAGCAIVATFVARGTGGEQTTWVASTWGEAGWYVGRGVNAAGVESAPTAPYPSPWNPISDGGLYWGPDAGLPDSYPPDVTEPEVLVQAMREQNYGGPVLRLKVSAKIPVPLRNFGAYQLYIENYQDSGRYAEWLTVNRGAQEVGTLTGYFVISPDTPSSISNFTEIEKITAQPGYGGTYKVTCSSGAIPSRSYQGSTGRIALWKHWTQKVSVVTVAYGEKKSNTEWWFSTPLGTDEDAPVGTKWHPESNQPLTESYAYIYTQRKLLGTYYTEPHLVKVFFVSISERGLRRDDWEASPCVWLPFGFRADMDMPTQVQKLDINLNPTMSGLLLSWEVPVGTSDGVDDSIDSFLIYRRRAGCEKALGLMWGVGGVVPDHTYQYASVPAAKLQNPKGGYQFLDRNFNINATIDPSTPDTGFDFDPTNPGWYEYVVTTVSATGFENRSFHAGQLDPLRNHNWRAVLGETQQTDAGPDRDTTHNRLFNTALLTVPYQAKVAGLPVRLLYGQGCSPQPCLALPDPAPDPQTAALYTFGYYYSLEAYVAPREVTGGLSPVQWAEPSLDKVNWVGSGDWDHPNPSDPRARELITSEAVYPKWDPRPWVNPYGKMCWNAATSAESKRVLKDDDIYWGWQTMTDDVVGGTTPSTTTVYPVVVAGAGHGSFADYQIELTGPPAHSENTSWATGAWTYVWFRSPAVGASVNYPRASWSAMFYSHVATTPPGVETYLELYVYQPNLATDLKWTRLGVSGVTAINNLANTEVTFLLGPDKACLTTDAQACLVLRFWYRTEGGSGSNTYYLWTGKSGGSLYAWLRYSVDGGGLGFTPCYVVMNNTGTRGISSGEVNVAFTGGERALVQLVRRDRFYPGEELIVACDFSLRSDGADEVSAPSVDNLGNPQGGLLTMWVARIDMNRYTTTDYPGGASENIDGPDVNFQRGIERDQFPVTFPITMLPAVPAGSKRNWMRFYGTIKIPTPLRQFTDTGSLCEGTGYANIPNAHGWANNRTVRLLNGTGPASDQADSLVMSTLFIQQIAGGSWESHLILKVAKQSITVSPPYKYVWDIYLKEATAFAYGGINYYVVPAFTHYAFGFGRSCPEGKLTFVKVGSSYVTNDAITIRKPMVNGGKVGVPWTNELYYAQAPGQDFDAEAPGGGYTPPPTGGEGDSEGGWRERDPDSVCVVGTTPILLADGTTKPAQLVRPGQKVVAVSNGRATVTKVEEVMVNRVDRVYAITDGDGETLVCSQGHQLAVRGQKNLLWRKAREVAPNDRLVAIKNGVLHLAEVLAVTERREPATVYTFTCSPHHNYVAGVFVSHNKRNRAIMV